jgi:hypothetical protein
MEVNDKNQTPQGKEASNATTGNDAGSSQQDEAVEEDEADNVQWEDPKEQ